MATQQTTEPRQTKTAFVRGVLQEIGAITPNPPEGWRQKVEEALKKHNLDMHQVTIYQIRQKALKDSQGNKGKPKPKAKGGRPKATVPVAAAPVAQANNVASKLTLADLQAIQTFAKQYGGVGGLVEACNALQTLNG
jgi:hypothetical protein